MIEIPPNKLPDKLLIAIIEEFINREGTDYGDREVSLNVKIENAKTKINQGEIILTFDSETESCNLLTKNEFMKSTKNSN